MVWTFEKTFRLIQKCLLLGLMIPLPLKAQQSAPSAFVWSGVVRASTGEPLASAKVTISAGEQKRQIVTGSDGTFAVADIAGGPHTVSVQLPERNRQHQYRWM